MASGHDVYGWWTRTGVQRKAVDAQRVSIGGVSTGGTYGGNLRLTNSTTWGLVHQQYPVAWFRAQQKYVQALLDNRPAITNRVEALYWALELMGAVSEGLFAFNANDFLWSRALYGAPKAGQAYDFDGMGIPTAYQVPSMARFFEAQGAVQKAMARDKVHAPKPPTGLPWGARTDVRIPAGYAEGASIDPDFLAAHAGDIARMKASGYWNPKWYTAKGKGDSYDAAHNMFFGTKPFGWKYSSVGPVANGIDMLNVAPFLSMPLAWPVQASTYVFWKNQSNSDNAFMASWFNDLIANVQIKHIPWAIEDSLHELYTAPFGIIARYYTFDQVGWSARFYTDERCNSARLAAYARGVAGGLVEQAAFEKQMWQRWSVLAFAYRRDRLGEGSQPSPFTQGATDFVKVKGWWVPTLADLEQFTATGTAFPYAYMAGAYDAWGAWFTQIDFAELVQAFSNDYWDYMGAGILDKYTNPEAPPALFGKSYFRAFVYHDDWQAIKKARKTAEVMPKISAIITAISFIIDLWTGQYAAAIGRFKEAVVEAKQISDTFKMGIWWMVYEAPECFLRSNAEQAADKNGRYPASMAFLSGARGKSSTILERMTQALGNVNAQVGSAWSAIRMQEMDLSRLAPRFVTPDMLAKPKKPPIAAAVVTTAAAGGLFWWLARTLGRRL